MTLSGRCAHNLEAACAAVRELGDAKPGDKTLVDSLDPVVDALRQTVERAEGTAEVLDAIVAAAASGWKSIEDLMARVGRSSRLGERSRGALDAGATSCYLTLRTTADTTKELLA